eukprot:TRINITY_DN3537_c0_g1_i1.p3 TRINITY_DN3537_c0_g1~~TRINITY_DN3537_c0_g1_i1.p3  ORF type:complete len:110 (-),score=26.48 TRINITY_DN3537_c0_g1_i1:590-877(-)
MNTISSRPTLHIYRDLLRLAEHVGKQNNNTAFLKQTIRYQFRSNQFESNQDTIEEKRQDAIRALTNYFIYTAMKENDQSKKEGKEEDSVFRKDDE